MKKLTVTLVDSLLAAPIASAQTSHSTDPPHLSGPV